MSHTGGRPPKTVDPGILDHGDPNAKQRAAVEAVIAHGSFRAAARAIGLRYSTVAALVKAVETKAVVQGYAPAFGMTHAVPQPMIANGVSTYFPKTKTTPAAWVKAKLDLQAYNEMVKAAISEFVEGTIGPIEVAPAPLDFQYDIIPWLQIGDAHIGMLAHAAQCTENFDLKIAERELCGAVAILFNEMPNCERIVINDLGDGTHYDNMAAVTAASGHALDADGRFPKMIKVYSRTMRFIVEMALTKAKFVDVLVNQGNHSRVNDFWMREVLDAAYGHTGRINILDNENVFTGYRMGNTLVMVHHSDKVSKAQQLIGVMTSDFREDFGQTQFHYIDIGHVHHHFVSKEHPSVVIESWNHLAANDGWAHENGYRSRKAITVVLRSRQFGDVGRRVLGIEEIRARLSHSQGTPIAPRKLTYSV